MNNQHDFKQARQYKIRPRDKVLLIHNGLDPYKLSFLPREEARLKLLEQASKKSAKVFQSKYIVGTIANFYPTKGLKYLIEAAREFKNSNEIIFLIIGDGEGRQELESAIKQSGLEKHVFLLGKVPEVARYLTGVDIFVLPSLKEGFAWGILEAMAAKLAIIATRVGAAEEIIENGKNGFLVEPKDSRAIANSIRSIIADSRLTQELGIQAHQTLLFKFSLDKMLSAIEKIL